MTHPECVRLVGDIGEVPGVLEWLYDFFSTELSSQSISNEKMLSTLISLARVSVEGFFWHGTKLILFKGSYVCFDAGRHPPHPCLVEERCVLGDGEETYGGLESNRSIFAERNGSIRDNHRCNFSDWNEVFDLKSSS